MHIISGLTVGEVTTTLNAIVTFLSITITTSFVVLFLFFIPKTNTALTWSSLTRTIHSSLWPTLLRTDSAVSTTAPSAITSISVLALATTLLVPLAGVILPLGLHEGPLLPDHPRDLPTSYIADSSPLSISSTPDRSSFQYGRVCGSIVPKIACPGNTDPNSTSYAPSLVDIFNSTPHGPFTMQYRRFFSSPTEQANTSFGIWATSESLFLRDGAFVVDGLVVDMSPDHPGIGFWNQSMPDTAHGSTWSQDILWLEPMTTCVNTNLTVDYALSGGFGINVDSFNITDRGGIYQITNAIPPITGLGQDIDLYEHAYRGAVESNAETMIFLNVTRESSFDGRTFTFQNSSFIPIGALSTTVVGTAAALPLSYLNGTVDPIVVIQCQGVNVTSPADISSVQVVCGAFLGPPLRTDGGDGRSFDEGSQWRQQIHVCASTTRASIQTVTFSTNGTTGLDDIQITHQPTTQSVFWAVEQTNMTIQDAEPLWGRVDDKYDGDPSVSTLRSGNLYVPAGYSIFDTITGGFAPIGNSPISAHSVAWAGTYTSTRPNEQSSLFDYTGSSDYAITAKLQSFMEDDPILGPSYIRNTVWNDIMANNVMGTLTNATVLASPYRTSIAYQLPFAIPGFILGLIWVPVFLSSVFLYASRKLSFKYTRQVLNHTSVGRIIVGTSSLEVHENVPGESDSIPLSPTSLKESKMDAYSSFGVQGDGEDRGRSVQGQDVDNAGDTLVTLRLSRKARNRSAENLMANQD